MSLIAKTAKILWEQLGEFRVLIWRNIAHRESRRGSPCFAAVFHNCEIAGDLVPLWTVGISMEDFELFRDLGADASSGLDAYYDNLDRYQSKQKLQEQWDLLGPTRGDVYPPFPEMEEVLEPGWNS